MIMSSKNYEPYIIERLNRQIGARIKYIRLQLCMSRKEVATKVGVSYQQFDKYERGTNRISAAMVVAIADALNLPVRVFLYPYEEADLSRDVVGSTLVRSFKNIPSATLQHLLAYIAEVFSDERVYIKSRIKLRKMVPLGKPVPVVSIKKKRGRPKKILPENGNPL